MHCPSRKQELQAVYRQSFQRHPAQEETALTAPTAAVGLLVKAPAVEARGLEFLLTLRSETVRSHAGQVCLPGGLVEARDGGNRLLTLDREFAEEVGVPSGAIEWEPAPWARSLSRFGVHVFSYLGFVDAQNVKGMTLQQAEVVDAAWLPLEKLLDASEWGARTLVAGAPDARGRYGMRAFPVWFGWQHATWGLTARFLQAFTRRISGHRPIE